jgi:hypothetical protein
MAILKRPMFRKGGSTNEGIMHGLERRGYADSNWEDLAKTYNISGSERFSGESDLYKNIDPNLINTGEGGYGTNWFKWLHDRGPDEPSTLVQSIFEEAQKSKTVPPEAIAGYKIPIPEGRPKEKIDTGNGTGTGTGTGTIDDISISDLNKERMKIFAPHMQKRMVADALGAASESFEKSTGNTKQDIARALGAAGRAMSDTRDIADQVSLLTLKGEIMKDVEASKPYKLNATETLIALGKSTDPEDKALFNTLAKGKDVDTSVILELYNKEQGSNKLGKATGNLYKIKANSANIETYGGDLPVIYNSKTKQEEESFEKMEEGKEYYNYLDGNFYKLDEKGEPVVIKKPDYLK